MDGRQAWTLILVIALLGAAGCIGDRGEPEQAQGLEPEEGDEASADDADLEHHSRSTEGSFGASHSVPGVGSNNYVAPRDPSKVNLPDTFEGGKLTFTWNGTGVGEMLLNIYERPEADGPPSHSFQASSSPFVVELEQNDSRVLDVYEVKAYAAEEPASVHADVEWSVEFSLLVATSMGDDGARNDSDPDAR